MILLEYMRLWYSRGAHVGAERLSLNWKTVSIFEHCVNQKSIPKARPWQLSSSFWAACSPTSRRWSWRKGPTSRRRPFSSNSQIEGPRFDLINSKLENRTSNAGFIYTKSRLLSMELRTRILSFQNDDCQFASSRNIAKTEADVARFIVIYCRIYCHVRTSSASRKPAKSLLS